MDLPRKADADPSPGWQLVESRKTKKVRFRNAPPAMSCRTLTPDYLGLLRITIPSDPRSLKERYGEEYAILVDFATRAIQYANLTSLAMYMHPLELLHLPAPITWPDKYQYATSGVREIAVVRRSLELVARLRIGLRFTASGNCQAVVVTGDEDNHGVSFKEWLAGLAEPDVVIPTGEYGYEVQAKWWEARGQFCDFPALPEDIQHKLLLHMVGQVCGIAPKWDLAPWQSPPGHLLTQCVKPDIMPNPDQDVPLAMPQTTGWYNLIDCGLLRLNKSSSEQVQKISRHHLTKHVTHHSSIYMVTDIRGYPNLDFLNRIQLAMSDFQYILFFGVELPYITSQVGATEPPATVLAKLSGLRYLEICFESIINFYYCNPWPCDRGPYGKYRDHFRSTDGQNAPDVDYGGFPCRKAMVDYLLSFAYKYIKTIPHVNLTGCIKQSTRDRWMDIFGAYKLRPETFEQKLLSHIAQIKALEDTELPPRCYCPVPCAYPDFMDAERRRPGRYIGPTYWNDGPHTESGDWRHVRDTERAIAGYHFDQDDSTPPVEFTGVGRKREKREVREGDTYAW
ncbi:hypothetical protein LTR17_016869 [Elasticomyces elasticus]|nr:hypothetical protein LTR17_016869 [Elasticomyces elasticus]